MRSTLLAIAGIAFIGTGAASAQTLTPEQARAFVVGRTYAFSCFEGTTGAGRIFPDGSVAGTVTFQSQGSARFVRLPPNTVRVRTENVCGFVDGNDLRALLRSGEDRPHHVPRPVGGRGDHCGATSPASAASTSRWRAAARPVPPPMRWRRKTRPNDRPARHACRAPRDFIVRTSPSGLARLEPRGRGSTPRTDCCAPSSDGPRWPARRPWNRAPSAPPRSPGGRPHRWPGARH